MKKFTLLLALLAVLALPLASQAQITNPKVCYVVSGASAVVTNANCFKIVDLSDTTDFPHGSAATRADIYGVVASVTTAANTALKLDFGFCSDVHAATAEFRPVFTIQTDENEQNTKVLDFPLGIRGSTAYVGMATESNASMGSTSDTTYDLTGGTATGAAAGDWFCYITKTGSGVAQLDLNVLYSTDTNVTVTDN